jgi:predicted restriction endonuclease
VTLRDGARCTFRRPDGARCENERYIEQHHVEFVSDGGDNSKKNIATLCSAHHRALHKGHAVYSPPPAPTQS